MSGEGTERIAIEGNILDRLEDLETLVQRIINGEVFANDLGNISQLSSRLDTELVASEYPSTDHITWITDDTGVIVAVIIGFHSLSTSPAGSGFDIRGRAKESGQQGLVALSAGDIDDNTLMQYSVRSTGDAYLDRYVTGTPAANDGPWQHYRGENSNNDITDLAILKALFATVTDNSEMAKLFLTLMQGGALYDYTIPTSKYIAAGNTTIATSETTLFDQTVPANWLAGNNLIRLTCNAVTVATTARTITWNLYYDDTVIATWTEATGSNATGYIDIQASLVSTGSNAQRAFVTSERYNATAGAEADQKVVGAATEDTTTVKNVKLTAQLSGAVTSAVVRNLVVEYLNGTQ
jgi:hypothetical protein